MPGRNSDRRGQVSSLRAADCPGGRSCGAQLVLGLVLMVLVGCRGEVLSVESLPVDQGHAAGGTEAHILQLPSTAGWVATGFQVEAGQSVSVIARGTVTVRSRSLLHRDLEVEAGPEGTYLFGDDVLDARFPLPAAGSGPAPCYGIIGRVDDGPVFPVGRHKSWTAKRSGMLWLSLNDDDPTDNSGSFHVQISRVPAEQPVRRETVIPATAEEGRPLPGCSVVVFYMDGLRPDIIHEMAALGHLPHISRLFVEGGTWPAAAFTGFPSDTITSNGTMWTGCFSDRHGLKGQVRFSRRTLRSESYLEPLGPSRSSRVLSPQGFDRLMHNTRRGTISMARGHEASEQWSQTHVSEIDPVYAHLRRNGSDWATGVLPLMTDVPPLLWTRSMVRSAPYFQSHEAWQHIDDANAHYAVSHLLPRKSPVTVIWLPETDSASHKLNRGQFGVTRRTIALADRLIGRVVRELEATGRLNQTYLMLVSDHGHHGGRSQHLSNFDLASDVFFRPREITPQGQWTGGGLGMSVRQHRQWNRHPEDPASAFVFMDGDSDGAARIFLPRGHFHSGQWQGPMQPATMFQYAVRPDRPPVNLVEQLSRVQAEQQDGSLAHPIDLVLLRLADDQMLISTADRGAAVITRRRNAANRWEYRYQVVTALTPREDGTVDWQPVPQPQVDPLGLLALYPAQLLARFHSELEWLELTAETEYPDSVVALTRHMLWDEQLRFRAEEYAPDLVVTARRGWYFGGHGSPGTMHGYPFRDAMQATLFVSGPNIRQGAQLLEYCRLADLTPTILEMASIPADPEHFDGRALRRLYRTEPDTATAERPVYWDEVDLAAWHPLRYSPRPVSPLLPVTVNRPDSPLDLNNLAYNLVTVGDINVTRLFDDVLFPLSPVRRPLTTAVDRSEEWVRSRSADWISGTAGVLDLSLLAIADYSPTSLGNIERALSLIDWVQGRGTEAGERAGTLVGRDQNPGQGPINRGVDRAQWGFREGYRTGQRLVMQLLDETLINGLENSTDRAVNRFRQHPAEIIRPASADSAMPLPAARVAGPIAGKSADQPDSGPKETSEPVGRVTVPGTKNVGAPTGRATVRGTLRTRY